MTHALRRPGEARPSENVVLTLLALLVTCSLTSTGCDGCRRDRPYTPFRVEASSVATVPLAPSADQPSTARSAESVPVVPPTESRKLEPPLGRLDVGARAIELPKDMLAERVIERPASVPGQSDALIWVIPAKSGEEWNGPMGELWLFPAGGDAKKLLALPGWMPSGPGCSHQSRLALLGGATALVDVVAKCERSLPQRTPVRALALVALGTMPDLLLGLRIAEPAADEAFTVTPLMSDRDGDGRADPSFRIEFDVTSNRGHAAADLGWLDRAAGASIDEGHLAASLEPTIVAWEAALGKRAKLASVISEVSALRRLLATLCQQSATSRLFDWRGETFRCPGMTQVATRLARVEVKAALGLGEALEAAHALGFATTWFGGIATVEREELRKRVSKSFVSLKVGLPLSTSVRTPKIADPVHYSPLRFDADSTSLFVQTAHGSLQQVGLDGVTTPVDSDAGMSAWPLAVVSADGRRWVSVLPACDRSELSLGLKAPNGQFLPLLPTRLLAPRPGVCKSPTTWPIATAPIQWQGDSPVTLIDGVCWAGDATHPCPSPDKLGPVVPGSPRSPDGRRLIVMTTLGPVVTGGSKPELWSGPGIDGKHLADCVVANGAKAIACVADGGQVTLLARPEGAN